MNNDHLTYRRGTVAASAGLVIQVLLTLAMGLTALWTESPAIQAATWHMLGGLPIWIVLVLIYSQYETERREALASSKLATQDAASSVLFGEHSDELQRARSRLNNLLGWGLSGVSLLVATYLVVAGLTLLWRIATPPSPDAGPVVSTIAEHVNPVGLLFVSGGLAFVSFVAGRWVSGYTRVRAWQLLRGGASYLMSCFVLAAVVLVGAIVAAVVDDTAFFRVVAVAVPMLMLLVGGEMLLAGLLAVYRPKRPGEIPRPAFDSRLLGLLTAPESLGQIIGELIHYQFGVEVSRSWLYQLLGQAVTPLTIFGAFVLFSLSTIVIVGPDEQGLILRFGAVRSESLPPGIHIKLPWPIETAVSLPIGRVLQVTVSSDPTGRGQTPDSILWTSDDDGLTSLAMEYFPTALDTQVHDTAGLALVNAEVVVQYRVSDIVEFLKGSLAPNDAIRVIASQEATRYFASHDLDTLLTRGRTEGGPALKSRIQERLDGLGLGFEIVGVSITSVSPPGGNVARSFHGQIGAEQERETLIERGRKDAVMTLAKVAGSVDRSKRINEAILELDDLRRRQSDANVAGQPQAYGESIKTKELAIEELLSEARGEAAELIHAARGYRWSRGVGERSSREAFSGELLAYKRAPEYYRTRRFLDVLAKGLADQRKFIIAGEQDAPVLKMDFTDADSAIDTLLGE